MSECGRFSQQDEFSSKRRMGEVGGRPNNPRQCRHENKGTDPYYYNIQCRDCGKVLYRSEPKIR